QIGMENIRIVETDGKEIVAVKRTDIDINSKKGRELAIVDNHSAKESIDLDFDVINDLVTEYDISPVEWELEKMDFDFSDKNKEIDVNGFDNEGIISFKFNAELFAEINIKINKLLDIMELKTKEQLLERLLNNA
ncbi:MAG TPA: hypothetical protein PKY56_04135, partial [Candidatus Kapabacteria bacterium]|nr:hypothetical protein [Candidatus Kapabacteria bacterium]